MGPRCVERANGEPSQVLARLPQRHRRLSPRQDNPLIFNTFSLLFFVFSGVVGAAAPARFFRGISVFFYAGIMGEVNVYKKGLDRDYALFFIPFYIQSLSLRHGIW